MRFLLACTLFSCCVIHLVGADTSPPGLVYNLTSGNYEATQVNILGKSIHKLIGVPYARVPLAFQKSILLNDTPSADRVLQKADEWPGMCIQTMLFNFEM